MTATDLIHTITGKLATTDAITQVRLIIWQAHQNNHGNTLPDNWQTAWYLLGTDGCHLCDNIKAHLDLLTPRLKLPPIKTIDIMMLDERLLGIVSNHIPILITTNRLLCYPFGLMDLVKLANATQ